MVAGEVADDGSSHMKKRAALLLLGALGCSGALTRGGAPAFEKYTEKLLAGGGLTPGVERCEMYGGTRAGYCTVKRTAPEIAALVASLPLAADGVTTWYGDSCASVIGFGSPQGPSRFELLPGAQRHVPNGTLPPNQSNVKLKAVVVSPTGTEVCFDYHFPYG
jgi:hypothetical protein